jgi:hypothetical protein
MVEAIGFVIRTGVMADLPSLEWEGEYLRYRAVYRAALEAAERGERALLVAEVDGKVVGQIFIHFVSPWPIPGSLAPAGYLYAFRVRPEHRGRAWAGSASGGGESLGLPGRPRRDCAGHEITRGRAGCTSEEGIRGSPTTQVTGLTLMTSAGQPGTFTSPHTSW